MEGSTRDETGSKSIVWEDEVSILEIDGERRRCGFSLLLKLSFTKVYRSSTPSRATKAQ